MGWGSSLVLCTNDETSGLKWLIEILKALILGSTTTTLYALLLFRHVGIACFPLRISKTRMFHFLASGCAPHDQRLNQLNVNLKIQRPLPMGTRMYACSSHVHVTSICSAPRRNNGIFFCPLFACPGTRWWPERLRPWPPSVTQGLLLGCVHTFGSQAFAGFFLKQFRLLEPWRAPSWRAPRNLCTAFVAHIVNGRRD